MGKRAKTGGASKAVPLPLSDFDEARGRWRSEVQAGLGDARQPEEPLRHRGARRSTRRRIGQGAQTAPATCRRWASPASRR